MTKYSLATHPASSFLSFHFTSLVSKHMKRCKSRYIESQRRFCDSSVADFWSNNVLYIALTLTSENFEILRGGSFRVAETHAVKRKEHRIYNIQINLEARIASSSSG
jgi:hypothetical protein